MQKPAVVVPPITSAEGAIAITLVRSNFGPPTSDKIIELGLGDI